MAYFDGPCSCGSSFITTSELIDSGIISPPAQTTLIAGQPIKVQWETNNTATGFSLDLMTYNGRCSKTPSTPSSRNCTFNDSITLLDNVPDTGEATVTFGENVTESRDDYVLVGSVWYRSKTGVTWYTYQQGFYTILMKEGDVPISLPTFEEINRNYTKHLSTSSSVPSATGTAVPTSATGEGVSKLVSRKNGLTLLVCGLLASGLIMGI